MNRCLRSLVLTSASIIALVSSSNLAQAQSVAGADVVYTNISDLLNHGAVGGINAYSIGSQTCNLGDAHMIWQNNGTPGFATNAFRLHAGRLMQIGVGQVKHACCVSNTGGCGVACQPTGPTGHLRIGCMDTYSASWNASQNRMGARFNINPFTGSFGAFNTAGGDAIFKRCQVMQADMNSNTYPGALYFIEGIYVGTEDAQARNWANNASYRQVSVNPTTYSMSLLGSTFQHKPTIYAWRDHGNGINSPDNTVTIVDVPVPSEGLFVAGYKTKDNGDGTWRYEYAVYNISSDRAGGSFSVPIGPGVTVTNVGFNDVRYHSGEPYDNTDWVVEQSNGAVTWRSPQTHAQNPNSNALRWGTMYNFWFDANRPPINEVLSLGLFKPGDPAAVFLEGPVPQPLPVCDGDVAPKGGDGNVNVTDLLAVISTWGPCTSPDLPCPTDIAPAGGDGQVNVADLLMVITSWGACP